MSSSAADRVSRPALLHLMNLTSGDLVGPQLAADPNGGWAAAALGRRTVPMPELRYAQPRLERCFVSPPGDHQPGGAPVSGLEEFEALEAVLVVHCTGAGGESVGEFVTTAGRHGDRV
jgi:hypothetical protein